MSLSRAIPPAAELLEVVGRNRMIVCLGPGGVGKTTLSAALGLHAAVAGRRVVVLTIDPARRLATAMGLEGRSSRARITNRMLAGSGVSVKGQLEIEMVDTRRMLEEVLTRQARDRATADRIRGNPFYRRAADALSGAQTYMALEKLHDIIHRDAPDLVVLDTPPSATALSFLQAPDRLVALLQSPFLASVESFAQPVNDRAARMMRQLARFTGREVFAQLGELVEQLGSTLDGLGDRAVRVADTLHRDDCAFLVVTTPRALAVEEATHFRRVLRDARFPFAGFVVNGVQPLFGGPGPINLERATRRLRGLLPGTSLEEIGRLVSELHESLSEATTLAFRERELLRALDGDIVVTVPRLSRDVHDFTGLVGLSEHLFPEPSRRAG